MKLSRILPVVVAGALLAMLMSRRPSQVDDGNAGTATPTTAARLITLDARHRTLSLLDDGHADLRMATMASRPVLMLARLGHLIDLGRWPNALPSQHDAEARLPAEERAALHTSYDNETARSLRTTMPIALMHLYLVGMGAMGDGRPEAVALLRVQQIQGIGTTQTVQIECQLLSRNATTDRVQRSLGRWSQEERGRINGYARLLPETDYGDPVKATYSLVYGTRDRRDVFLTGFDLRYGREERLLEVRPWALGQGAITPIVGGVEPWQVPDEMWVSAIEAVPATRFAVRLQDELTDLLAEITVSEIDEHGQLAMAWRVMTDAQEVVKAGAALRGRVHDASGQPVAHALVWIDGPGLERLPFALRSTTAGDDGAFNLPRPSQLDIPLLCTAAAPAGAGVREVTAADQQIELEIKPAWRVRVEVAPADGWPVVMRFTADTLALIGFADQLPTLPQLVHGRFDAIARGALWLAQATRDAPGETGELVLPLTLESRAALRVSLVQAESGLWLRDVAAISVQVAGASHELRCERGEGFFPALPPGHATISAGSDRAEIELRAGELAEVELSPDR